METHSQTNSKCVDCKYAYQYFAVFAGSLALFSTGMHHGWPSPSLPILLNKNSSYELTSAHGSWIAAAPSIGSPIGSIIGAVVVDRIGRRKSLLTTSPALLLSWLLVAFTTSYTLLLGARMLAGVASGLIHTVFPVYIGEIADKKIRGSLGVVLEIASKGGMLLVNVLGLNYSIKTVALLAAIVPVMHFATFFFAPETPSFWIMKGRTEKAMSSFAKLSKYTLVESINLESSKATTPPKSTTFRVAFSNRSDLKALGIVSGLMLLLHFSGSFVIMYYCLTIFKEANGKVDEGTATTIYFSVQMLATILSSLIVDFSGRKPLLIISAAGAAGALAVEGVYFYLKSQQAIGDVNLGYLPVTALAACTLCFNIGITTIPGVIIGELFSMPAKAYASCLCNMCFGVFGTAVTKLFQIIKEEYGLHVPLFGFALCCIIGLIFIVWFVPETKGKTLEEIQVILDHRKSKKTHDNLQSKSLLEEQCTGKYESVK